MIWFHAEVKTIGWGSGFLLDLDESAVVQDLLMPIYNKDVLVLDGRQVPMTKLDICRIVITDEPVQPRLRQWFEAKSISPSKPKAQFLAETRFFDIERDVSNSLLREFRLAMELAGIKELLAHQWEIKQKFAEQLNSEGVAQVKSELSNTSVQIAQIVGTFLGAVAGGYMRTKET